MTLSEGLAITGSPVLMSVLNPLERISLLMNSLRLEWKKI